MHNSLFQYFKNKINSVMAFFGYQIKKVSKPRDKKNIYKNKNTGGSDLNLDGILACDTIIDIGVAGGTPWLYEKFKKNNLILIDPFDEIGSLELLLSKRKYKFYKYALGSENKKIRINYDLDQPMLTSKYIRSKISTSNHKIVEREVFQKKLDTILGDDIKSLGSIGIKIDTEGAELDILKGSINTLKHTKFLILEVSILDRFTGGSYNFSELIVFLYKQGFKVEKILRFAQSKDGLISLADIYFIKF